MNPTLAKAITYGGVGAGALFPVKSLYNSGQENRGLINSTAHLAVGTAVGGAVAGGAAYFGAGLNVLKDGPMEVAKKLAKGAF